MDMDSNELWRQIKVSTKMRLSIDMDTLARWPDGAFQFDTRYPRRRRFIIRLNGADLYDIQFGRVDRRSFEWHVLAESHDVGVEQLNGTLLRLAGLDLRTERKPLTCDRR
jgi:hypothetical protein